MEEGGGHGATEHPHLLTWPSSPPAALVGLFHSEAGGGRRHTQLGSVPRNQRLTADSLTSIN
eukprot:356886-Chlamydomonas_euryale.AAC.2